MPIEPIISGLQRTLTARDPLVSLQELQALRAELDGFEREQVRRALQAGASYGDVARAIGITRQAAHRRYRTLLDTPPPAPRLVASPEALAVLQRARQEAGRRGASVVEGEHVVLALKAADAGTPSGGLPGAPLGPRLRASLRRVGTPIGVDELLHAALEDPAARALRSWAEPGRYRASITSRT